MVRLVKKSNHTSRRGRRERRRGAGRMRRRAVFVAIVALLAGCIPAVRSLDPWERASGDASEIVESSLSSSSSSSSLRDDGNDEDGGSATRTTDDSVLAPPAPRLYPPGTGAYAPPGEGSVRSKRRKGYENTIAAQIEKAIDAEFSDEDVANDGAQTNRGGSARGDGLGDGSAALLVNDGAGRFTESADAAGVAEDGFGASATFFDYDRDGALDLYVTNYVGWSMAKETLSP